MRQGYPSSSSGSSVGLQQAPRSLNSRPRPALALSREEIAMTLDSPSERLPLEDRYKARAGRARRSPPPP